MIALLHNHVTELLGLITYCYLRVRIILRMCFLHHFLLQAITRLRNNLIPISISNLIYIAKQPWARRASFRAPSVYTGPSS